MASKIKYNDLIDKEVKEGLKELLNYFMKLSDEIEKLKKSKINININQTGSGESFKQNKKVIDDLYNSTSELINKQKELEKLEKKIALISFQTTDAYKNKAKELNDLKEAQKAETKAAKDATKAEEDYKNSIKETYETIDELSKITSSQIALRKKLNLQTKEGRQEFEKLTKTISENQKKLKSYDAQIGNYQRNVGNYASGVKEGLQSIAGFNFSDLASKSTLVAGAITGAFMAMKEYTKAAIENEKLQKKIGIAFKTNAAETENLSIKVKQIASYYDKDYNEIIVAANTITKEFGITGDEALKLIAKGFEKGSDLNGEFLDQIREYPAQMVQAGITAEQFFNIINKSVTEGIYSDKGVDSLKEAGIQLRENTKAVQDVLRYLDPQIKKEIELNAERGNTIKSMQLISKEFNKGKLSAQKMQEIVSTLFVGAGEDAGMRWLKMIENINIETDKTGETSKTLTSVLKNISDNWTEFTTRITNSQGAIGKWLTYILDNLNNILSILVQISRQTDLSGTFKGIFNLFYETGSILKAVEISINTIIKGLNYLGANIDEVSLKFDLTKKEAEKNSVEITQNAIDEIKKLRKQKEIDKEKEIQSEKDKAKILKQEYEKYLKERQEIRDKYGLTSQREYYEREYKDLFNALQKRLITYKEYLDEQAKLRNKYAEKTIGVKPISTQGSIKTGTTLSKLEDEKLKAKGVITELQTPIYPVKKEEESLSSTLLKRLGIEPEKQDEFKTALRGVTDTIISEIDRVNKARIEQTDIEISESQKRLDNLNNELSNELKLMELGLANDYKLKQKAIENEKTRLQQLETERKKEIERSKKYERAQLGVNFAAEIANYAKTSSTLKWPANLILFALLSAGATLRYANNLRMLNTQKYAKGTEFVDKEGRYESGIDTVPTNLTRGERVLTVEQNKKLRGIKNKDIPFLTRAGALMLHLNSIENKDNTKVEQLNETKETNRILRKFRFSENSNVSVDLNGNRTITI